ncbi:hypothetical protein J2X01_004319 [Arthrobacter ginsengisoli]|uniref:Uncharacterized protein n=1 Tax=Arthrobacter ginsengisoli TaxID=1356565 RepID=A0ABU1UIJ2_9MICC|nr:hypothetical protein [Arthrobacter ginsengisoli]MDR7084999.1 hypothetical protein [Arthrobacter ginsengisoli]
MKTLFNGRLWVHYGQAYVVSGPVFDYDLEASFRGQSNGLCGASSPSLLFLITGLHTGHVNFSVQFSDAEPPLDWAWEDVVEVSSTMVNRPFLKEWAGQVSYPIDLAPGTYRVRYAARGMDSARAVDTIVETEEPIDTYQLSFWPAEGEAPDRVVRQESQTAAYWNGWANSLHPTS